MRFTSVKRSSRNENTTPLEDSRCPRPAAFSARMRFPTRLAMFAERCVFPVPQNTRPLASAAAKFQGFWVHSFRCVGCREKLASQLSVTCTLSSTCFPVVGVGSKAFSVIPSFPSAKHKLPCWLKERATPPGPEPKWDDHQPPAYPHRFKATLKGVFQGLGSFRKRGTLI